MLNKKPTDWINSENLYMWGVPIMYSEEGQADISIFANWTAQK